MLIILAGRSLICVYSGCRLKMYEDDKYILNSHIFSLLLFQVDDNSGMIKGMAAGFGGFFSILALVCILWCCCCANDDSSSRCCCNKNKHTDKNCPVGKGKALDKRKIAPSPPQSAGNWSRSHWNLRLYYCCLNVDQFKLYHVINLQLGYLWYIWFCSVMFQFICIVFSDKCM